MIDGNQKFILDKLELLKGIKLNEIYRGIPNIPSPGNATFSPVTRINIVLSGNKKIYLPLEQGPTHIVFREGDVQLSPPNTWELQSWDTESEFLCIVQRQDYLRISHYTVTNGYPGRCINHYYHTHRHYPESFQHTFKAINAFPGTSDTSILKQLIKTVILYSIEECSRPPNSHLGKADFTFERLRKYIENSFQEDITRDSLAERFSITPGYLSQLFKRKAELSFIDYLTNCRLEFAKYLLMNTDIPVYQVADQSGFRNYVHFIRRFREYCGIPPGKYRETF